MAIIGVDKQNSYGFPLLISLRLSFQIPRSRMKKCFFYQTFCQLPTGCPKCGCQTRRYRHYSWLRTCRTFCPKVRRYGWCETSDCGRSVTHRLEKAQSYNQVETFQLDDLATSADDLYELTKAAPMSSSIASVWMV